MTIQVGTETYEKTGTWVSEHIPAYMIDSTMEKPWRDEDVAMTYPVKVGKGLSYRESCVQMACHLDELANVSHIMRSGEGAIYRMAAANFLAASHVPHPVSLMIHLYGRVYQVRDSA